MQFWFIWLTLFGNVIYQGFLIQGSSPKLSPSDELWTGELNLDVILNQVSSQSLHILVLSIGGLFINSYYINVSFCFVREVMPPCARQL